MGAGKPDYAKLHEMGKLPKDARGNIPLLADLDKAEKKISKLEEKIEELKEENAELKKVIKEGKKEVE